MKHDLVIIPKSRYGLVHRRKGANIDTLLKYAGAWKNVSDEKIKRMKRNMRKWRAVQREFAR